MSHHIRIRTTSTLAMLLAVAVAACADDSESPSGPAYVSAAAFGHVQPTDAGANADLAAARRATAHLQRFENAAPGGWDIQVTPCMEIPSLGGMGYHYANLDYYLDGEANPTEPEILLYEPQSNGGLRLVALEYAVPFFAWGTGDPEVDDPPLLFGRDMNRADAREQWELHVWLWKHNPSGLFEDWNPNVTCEHA
jgi:hypothetical protein